MSQSHTNIYDLKNIAIGLTVSKLFNIRSFTFVHSSEMNAHSARP